MDDNDFPYSELLARLTPDPQAEIWEEVCTELLPCGGTTDWTSYAALPTLTDVAARWAPNQRCMILVVASAIVASEIVQGSRDKYLHEIEAAKPRLAELTRDSLAKPGWPQNEFIYLLQAARAFDGDQLWGNELECLNDGEFSGVCPHCEADMKLIIGKYGFFTTNKEWVNQPNVPRTPITPNHGELAPVGRWLQDQARAAKQTQVTEWISYVFGTGSCPSCGQSFLVADAIAKNFAAFVQRCSAV